MILNIITPYVSRASSTKFGNKRSNFKVSVINKRKYDNLFSFEVIQNSAINRVPEPLD